MEIQEESILDYAVCEDGNETTLSFYNLSTVSTTEVYVHAAILAVTIVIGLCGNGIILLLIACDKRLRYRSTYAALNIVFVDFLLTIFYHGVSFASLVLREWPYGSEDTAVCKLYSFMSPYFIYVRWIGLSLISVDRFLSVRFPFHYERHNKAFLIILSVIVWCVPFAFGATMINVGKPTFRTNVPTCLVSCVNEKEKELCQSLNVFLFSITFVIGGLIPSILYTWMYRQGRRLRPKIVMGTFIAPAVHKATSNAITTTRNNINSEVTRERRTLSTLILLYLTVLLTSIPQYLLILLRGVQICAFFKIPLSIHFIVANVFFLSTALDPLVVMRNQDFRIAFQTVFLRCKRRVVQPLVVTSMSMSGLTNETAL